MLAERYLYHLESGYSPLTIVALTFTEKAAAELRSRIRQTVGDRLPNSDFVAELEAAQLVPFMRWQLAFVENIRCRRGATRLCCAR
jgi:ATP-dependent helicase/nuclease subunit A